MVCARSTGIRDCGAFCRTHRDFCQMCRNSANAPHFHSKRHRNPWIVALYKTAGALRHGHQSAALLVGEKRRTCRHVFKCCRSSTFVGFFFDAYCSVVCSVVCRYHGKQPEITYNWSTTDILRTCICTAGTNTTGPLQT